MSSGRTAKQQKAQEKKNKKRALKRKKHLEQRFTAKQLAEHDHWLRFHTSPEDLTEEQRQHYGEQVHDHEIGSDEQRQQQLNQPLDVGTTRMKLDWDNETPQQEAAGPMSIDELRESLGLR